MQIVTKPNGMLIEVSDEDFPLLNLHSWYIDNKGYARTHIGGNDIKMHQLVCRKEHPCHQIDHINRNKLDNRRENLRSVDSRCNTWNSKRDAGRSEYMGVKWNSSHNKFIAGMSHKNKRIAIASGDDVEELAKFRDYFVWRLRGEFGVLNFPDFDYSTFEHPKKEKFDKRIELKLND